MNRFKLSVLCMALWCTQATAQTSSSDAPAVSPTSNGFARMKSIMDAVKNGSVGSLPAPERQAVETGLRSGTAAADTNRMDAKTVDFAVDQAANWDRMAREAYVAALPPRDRPLGASVLLGDGTREGLGEVYIFVSRSMPQALLRAYAVDAFYMGAQLVVKGLRKGDTLKEYITEAMETFNSLDGMSMAGIDINPNMFDMFDVKMVPAVVWTNRVGLSDVGSGCQNLPEGSPIETITLDGPDEDSPVEAERPRCARLPDSAYYKLTGALAMPYVLDRFQEAGLAKTTADSLRARLAERTSNLHDGSVQQVAGNAMAPVSHSAKLDRLPKGALRYIQSKLATSTVQRGPFGPTFSPDQDDDAQYRQELEEKVRHGLGL